MGGYQLVRCLGHGTHTAVYRATGSLGSQWALKVIDRQLEPEAALVERLRREASLCARVDHPAILPMYDGDIVGVELPAAVELTVTETEPGVQGDRVSGARKPATLETGLVVQVPLFVEAGERSKVDTRSGEYLARA